MRPNQEFKHLLNGRGCPSVSTNGLLAYWQFEDNTNNYLNGITYNLVNWATASYVTGKYGKAYDVSATNSTTGPQALSLTSSTIVSGNQFTVCGWINTSSTDATYAYGSGYSGAPICHINFDNGSFVRWYATPVSGSTRGMSVLIGDTTSSSGNGIVFGGFTMSTWNFIGISWDGIGTSPSFLKTLISVSSISSSTFGGWSSNYTAGTCSFILGSRNLVGYYDDWLVFNRALTKVELETIRDSGNPYLP